MKCTLYTECLNVDALADPLRVQKTRVLEAEATGATDLGAPFGVHGGTPRTECAGAVVCRRVALNVGIVHQECHAHRIAVVERTIAQLGSFVPCATTGVNARALARLLVSEFDRARLALRHKRHQMV